MNVLARAALAALAALGGACEVTREVRPAGSGEAIVTHTQPARAWKVRDGDALLGSVVLFADPGEPDGPAKHYYSVRNPWHQELGTIDAQGRAYKHVPHAREAQWVATGTLLEGARAVLGGGPATELSEVPLAELERGADAAH